MCDEIPLLPDPDPNFVDAMLRYATVDEDVVSPLNNFAECSPVQNNGPAPGLSRHNPTLSM